MARRILVAVDGSSMSDAALDEAVELSRLGHGLLRVVHVIDSPYSYPDVLAGGVSTADLEAIRLAWEQGGQQILDRAVARARAAGVEPESALLNSGRRRVAVVISEEAARWRADMVALGTHGRRGLDRVLLGSVAEGVARIAPAPVLLVRTGEGRPEPAPS